MKEMCPVFFKDFVRMHEALVTDGRGHAGHGIDHDLMVASYALLIADDEQVGKMAWVAGLLHSVDRFFGEVSETVIDRKLSLVRIYFSEAEITEIKTAVLRHDGPNSEDDSPTKVVLQDADRLANVGPLIIVRCGQFRPGLPAIEIGATGPERAPGSTYKAPRSCKDDLIGHLEWEADPKFGLRTPKAKMIGKKYFDFLREFFSLTNQQFVETGLDNFNI